MAGERVVCDLLSRSVDDGVLRNSDDTCLRIDSDTSVEMATGRVFVVHIYIYILDDLRQLAKSFDLTWQYCTARLGKAINCNRANRKSNYSKKGVRRSTSINGGCKWSIRFLSVVKWKHTTSDPVVITSVISSHSDKCDPSDVDQLVLCRSCSSAYARCGDQVLKEIMVKWLLIPMLV